MTPYDAIDRAISSLRDDLLAFAQRLVRIPSVPGHEAPAQQCAADQMRALGLDVAVIAPTRAELSSHPAFCDDGLPVEERPSVVGIWRAPERRAGARSIALNGHLDVVSPGNEALWSDSPWSGRIAGGRLHGRGSCDMKGGVACAVFAIAALQRAGLAPGADVLIETVSGEESGGIGTLGTIVRGYRADAAIILEPTRLRLCPVQAGALTFRLVVPGRSAHGALKRSGVSAIDNARLLLTAIDDLERKRHARFTHPLYDDPLQMAPVSVGVFRSGDWPSTVPNEAVAEGRFGVFPGESVQAARQAFEAAIADRAREDDWMREHAPRVEWIEGQFESGETPLDAPIVRLLAAQHARAIGRTPTLEGVTYGSDLRLFTNHAHMPAVLYGPGDVAQAHAVDEWIQIEEMLTACRVIAATVAVWACGADT
ncbi:MAG TPA: ArgE/DapE family deacylase [Vicinamibacterales bacterium]|nr:ArgE/DapE family deacylase [Vicinamibacterales bacterium]